MLIARMVRLATSLTLRTNISNIKGKIEITDVWLQQINDISESDAKAEGFDGKLNSYTSDLYAVWIGIYGIDSWINNEWVWVIEFKKVE